jgi:hypothetical protein
MSALVRFQKEVTSLYNDVYWISNQKLIAWMKNATDIDGALRSPELDCLMPATDPSNKEICDGIDNNGDGTIDEGLQNECYYAAIKASFNTCYGCPSQYPDVNSPTPLSSYFNLTKWKGRGP